MKKHTDQSRRNFLKKGTQSAAVLAATAPWIITGEPGRSIINLPWQRLENQPFSANDQIQIACIGMGIMGFGNVKTALMVPGTKLVAVCDLYDGRLKRAKEVFGKELLTTRDYREILNNPAVDAVIIATSDHWHEKIAIEAMAKGKAVYCEKPMTQTIAEGQNLVKAHQQYKTVFQVGSQYVSNIPYRKARELLLAGEIGELNFAEAIFDRQSAIGAWQYSIPLDASPKTVDWDRFIGHAPKRSFDATRFFRWRNYQDYGTGIPGDLFVHLFSGLHMITGSLGPDRIMATGGLRYWNDGRDVADVMLGLYDYPKTDAHPAFNVALRVNFADGSGGGSRIRLVGSEGELELDVTKVVLRRKPMAKAPGYTVDTFEASQQTAFKEAYARQYSSRGFDLIAPREVEYKMPEHYGWEGMRISHFEDFMQCIREKKETVEPPHFGLRAAGPALATNLSHYEKKVVQWDPNNMQIA
jgi:predicted dehydrogenase